MNATTPREVAFSKLRVGAGAEFPVDSAEPASTEEDRNDNCAHGRFRSRRRYRRRHGWSRGGLLFGPLGLIAFIAIIFLAVAYPGVVLGVVAVAILAFALHSHHRHGGDDGFYDRGHDRRDHEDVGPQPDAGPDASASGRN